MRQMFSLPLKVDLGSDYDLVPVMVWDTREVGIVGEKLNKPTLFSSRISLCTQVWFGTEESIVGEYFKKIASGRSWGEKTRLSTGGLQRLEDRSFLRFELLEKGLSESFVKEVENVTSFEEKRKTYGLVLKKFTELWADPIDSMFIRQFGRKRKHEFNGLFLFLKDSEAKEEFEKAYQDFFGNINVRKKGHNGF